MNDCPYCGGRPQIVLDTEPETDVTTVCAQCRRCRRKTIETHDYAEAVRLWDEGAIN